MKSKYFKKLFHIVMFSVMAQLSLFCCNPEPGPLHFAAPPPVPKMQFDGYWLCFDKTNGFVDDYITCIKGVTTEKDYKIFAGTRKNGLYVYSPSVNSLSFTDLSCVVRPVHKGVVQSINDFVYFKNNLMLIATPVGLFKGKDFHDFGIELPSKNIIGLVEKNTEKERKIVVINTRRAITLDGGIKFKLPDNEVIVNYKAFENQLYLLTPKKVLIYDITNGTLESEIEYNWCEDILVTAEYFVLAGIQGLKYFDENQQIFDIVIQKDQKHWMTAICGVFTEKLLLKLKIISTPSVVKSRFELLMNLIKKLKKKYTELCEDIRGIILQVIQLEGQSLDVSALYNIYYHKMMSALSIHKQIKFLLIELHDLLTKDHVNKLWIGTKYNGIFSYSDTNDVWINMNKDNTPLRSNEITSLFQQNDRLVWIGTADGGLYRYGNYDLGETGMKPILLCNGDFLTVKKSGLNIYGLEREKGVYHYNGGTKSSKFIIPSGDGGLQFSDLEVDDDANLWVGTKCNGLFKYDWIKWNQFTKEAGIPSENIEKIHLLKKTKTIMISCHNAGQLSERLATYHQGNWENYQFNSILKRLPPNSTLYKKMNCSGFEYDISPHSDFGVNSFLQMDDRIIIGTDQGVYIFTGDRFHKNNGFAHLVGGVINKVGTGPDGKLLFATYGGVVTHDGIHYGSLNLNLPIPVITDFVKDQINPVNFWFSSGFKKDNGLLVSYNFNNGNSSLLHFKFMVRKIVVIYPYVFMATPKGLYYIRISL